MNQLLFLKPLLRKPITYLAAISIPLCVVLVFFLPSMTGISLLDVVLKSLIFIIALGSATISGYLQFDLFSSKRKFNATIDHDLRILPIPIYEPLARTRMPNTMKKTLSENRETFVEAADSFIDSDKKLLVITGDPGIGKSTVAAYCARRADFWLNLNGKKIDLQYLLQQLASWLEDEELRIKAVSGQPLYEDDLHRLLAVMEGEERRLIFRGYDVLLNEEDQIADSNVNFLFNALLQGNTDIKIILTSSRELAPDAFPEVNIQIMALGGLDELSGSKILQLESGGDGGSVQRLEMIASSAGGNPLIIKLLPAAIAMDINDDLDDRTPWKSKKKSVFLNPGFIEGLADEGIDILRRATLFPEPVTASFLATLSDDEQAGQATVKMLAKRNLIDWDGGMKKYTLHPAIAASAHQLQVSSKSLLNDDMSCCIDICLKKTEDFKPRSKWESVNDCRLLVRAMDMSLKIKAFPRCVEILSELSPLLRKWQNLSLLKNFMHRFELVAHINPLGKPEEKAAYIEYLKFAATRAIEANNLQRAVDCFRAMVVAGYAFGSIEYRILGYSRLSELYKNVNEPGKARRYLKLQLKTAKKGKNKALIAAAHGRIGHLYRQMQNYEKAQAEYLKAIDLFGAANKKRGLSAALGYLSEMYAELDMVEESINLLNQQLKVSTESKDSSGKIATMRRLANAYIQLGQTDKATLIYEQLVEEYEKSGDEEAAAEILLKVANMATRRNDFTKALMLHQQRLSIAKKKNNQALAGNAYGLIGHCHLKTGDAKKAIENYRKAEECFTAVENVNGVIKSKYYSGKAYQHLEDWSAAYEAGLKAVSQIPDMNNKQFENVFRLVESCLVRLPEDSAAELAIEILGRDRWQQVKQKVG